MRPARSLTEFQRDRQTVGITSGTTTTTWSITATTAASASEPETSGAAKDLSEDRTLGVLVSRSREEA